MKKRFGIIAAIFCVCAAFAASAQTAAEQRYGTDLSSDMALIYAGGDQRPEWTAEEIEPYVIHTYADGTRDWFFDAFLFLEFSSGSTGVAFDNGGPGRKALKADYEWLLDRTFAPGCKLAALDSVIEAGKTELGEPRLRHKIVLGIPAPVKVVRDWGELNGRHLDFNKDEDRIEATKWFIDQVIRRFDAAGYRNIDLMGIYWIEEALFTNGGIMPAVNDYIYRRGLRSYWIPYYKDNEQFRFNWKKYGFDMAYQQPNYFFERDIPYSRLEIACDESKRLGMGLEMEFETQGTSRVQHDDPDSYYTRLVDYLDVFEKKGVFDEAAVAWYSGTKGFLDLARSKDSMNHAIADRMARIVAERQKAKAASLKYPEYKIRDLALIYHGDKRRPEWTVDDFVPYVSHKFADGHRDWTFDGFLFLETDIDGKVRFFPWAGDEGATKADWQWYIDRLYQKDRGLDALDKCISRLKKEIGKPGFKHKIVLMMPVPVKGNKHWGSVDGRALDFDNVADQVAASEWYINQVAERFKKAKYKNLELTGIYWLDEDMCHTDGFPRHIAPFIHSKGLDFVWIPYFKGRGYESWRELGFDIAYQQPNYIFHTPRLEKRLDEACDVSLVNGMAMEFECDGMTPFHAENSNYDGVVKYIDAFERNKVWQTCPVAYYTGTKGLLELLNNPCPENQALTDRLFGIIVDRRAKMAK